MKINHRYFILLLLALFTFSLSLFGYIALYNKVVAKASESKEAQFAVDIENEKKQHEQELSLLYAETLKDRTRLYSFIVSQAKIVEFIEALEKIGPDSKTLLELSAINAPDLSSKAEGFISTAEGHIEISGTWSNVMRALTLIENMPYSLTIRHMKLITSIEKKQNWTLSLDIKFLITK